MRDEEGVTAMEYGLLVALISVLVMASLVVLALSLEGNLNTIQAQLGKGGSGA